MDGNGRWAKAKGLIRSAGHKKGSSIVKSIIRKADALSIKALSLYCFSNENWNRPQQEISLLMELLENYLKSETPELVENNVKLIVSGRYDEIPKQTLSVLENSIDKTKRNTGLILNFCLGYGGQQEIVRATKLIAQKVVSGALDVNDISKQTINEHLYTGELPNLDLVIRTSGEQRLSNFLTFQSAYAELIFLNKMWPDFSANDLEKSCLEFQKRQRRFGKTSQQIEQKIVEAKF